MGFYRVWDRSNSSPLYQIRRDGQEHRRIDLPENEDDSAKMAYGRIDWLKICESAWLWQSMTIFGVIMVVLGLLLALRRILRPIT